MFLLNNIRDRDYRKDYPNINNVIFDISEKQLSNEKNSDWYKLKKGSIACVVKSTRKVATFFVVESVIKTGINDDSLGELNVVTGRVVAKLSPSKDMTGLLNSYKVSHIYLPNNKFSIGFNIASIGDGLNNLSVKAKTGNTTIGLLSASDF